MKFMIVFPLDTTTFKERVARFLETGAPPPAGVTLHGRWHSIAGDQGFMLVESGDAKAVFRWITQWADLLDFEIYPVLDDEEAGGVLSELAL